jgi:aspartate racemase
VKIIGLVGGTSWVSTVDYYRAINELVNRERGGMEFAECILYSYNFAEIKGLTEKQDWKAVLERVSGTCQKLTRAGAQCIVLCANTMHLIADDLARRVDVPIIHIAEATGAVIQARGMSKVGLLGTKFTMEMDFFKKKLADRGIQTVIPGDAARDYIHASIFEELGRGVLEDRMRRRYLEIIAALKADGAQGIVLGCTEIGLLIKPADCDLPLFDTGAIHAAAAVKFALG